MDLVNINYCRKIRIYPNKEQIVLFNKCFNATRYIYNKGVEYLNKQYRQNVEEFKKLNENNQCIHSIKCKNKTNNGRFLCYEHKDEKIKWDIQLKLSKLRPHIMKNDPDLPKEEKWLKDVPYDTRQLSIKSLIGNMSSCLTNKARGNITKFRLGFKSKKDERQIFFYNGKAIGKLGIFKQRLGKRSKIRVRKRYKDYYKIKKFKDGIILRDNGRYYILISKKKEVKHNKGNKEIVALDPGVRTFQTYYSPNGECGKFGDDIVNKKLRKKYKRIRQIQSVMSKCKLKGKTRRRMKKRSSLLRTKIKNIVRDMHWKTCAYLVKKYKTIITPKFETSKMMRSNLNRKTKSAMSMLSHYQFLEKLKMKCKEYQRRLILVSEAYTSKTCSNCGNVNRELGGKKIYECKKCGVEIDRDINGARNILYRGIDTFRKKLLAGGRPQ